MRRTHSRDAASVKRRQRALLVALVAADLVLAAAVSARFFFRVDLSRNRMYTLSAASRSIVAGLQEPLSITYYVSDKLRGRYPFPAQVEDLLNEYAAVSRGKVDVRSLDPARSTTPVRPEQLGIVAQQMQVVEREETTVATVYSGIVIQYLDRSEALPFVTDLATLEYDLSSKVRAVVANSRRTVGILLGDTSKSFEQNFRYLLQEMSAQFDLRPVDKGVEVPPEVPVLLVIGSRDMDEYDVLAVDRFLMRGGRALLAVDSVEVNLAQGLVANVNQKKAMADALARWGVTVRDELVLDTANQRLSFRMQSNQYMIVNYPHWVTVRGQDVSRENPITSRFAGLDLFWPCVLEISPPAGVTADAIVRSTASAWSMKTPFETNPALSQLLAQQAGERRQFPLVVALSGEFPSAFAGRALPARPGEAAPPSPPAAKSPSTRLLVVADADFASDTIQYTQAQYNLAFVSNCAEWLSMEDDLLAIKTRAQADTRLSRIADPARRAAAMRASQVVNVAVVPLFVVAAGVARLLLRRRRKARGAAEPARQSTRNGA
jgi:ABC-2 type transport system permease protein